jgi:hypothetical protein
MDDKWKNNDPLCKFVYEMVTTPGTGGHLFDRSEYEYSSARIVKVKETRLATRTLPPPYGTASEDIQKIQKMRFYRSVGKYLLGSHAHSYRVTIRYPITLASVRAKMKSWIINPDATILQLAEIIQSLIQVEE